MICRAILFDLDGVLVDSRGAVELSWQHWAELRKFDPGSVLRIAHGRRTSETIREIAPQMDVDTEVALLERLESEETRGLHVVAGAVELVHALKAREWAIVTSGSPKVALMRMRYCGIPTPEVFVTAHDVRQGKPAPDGYLAAARELKVAPHECLVIEDSAAGIASGKAAGAMVIAVAPDASEPAEADRIAEKLSDIHVRRLPGAELAVSLKKAN